MIVGGRARIGRWLLRAEGFVLGIFGGAGLAWTMANPQFGALGAPIMWLRVTPWHCGLMLGAGVVTIFASFGRTAAIFSRIAAVGWLVITVNCVMATANRNPGPLGFDAPDSVLYGILTVYNLILAVWFTMLGRRQKTPVPSDQNAPVGNGHAARRLPQRQSDAVSTP